ncbi:MAG: hypothetical protein ACI8V2_002806 [Candidatus Latescibacterota bacterium]
MVVVFLRQFWIPFLFFACSAFGDLLFKRLKSKQKVARSSAARGCTAQISLVVFRGDRGLRDLLLTQRMC